MLKLPSRQLFSFLSMYILITFEEKDQHMSSGSYFTIYRKHSKKQAPAEEIDRLKEEYRKSNYSSVSTSAGKNEDDFPVLMHASFKNELQEDDEECNTYYDKDGFIYDKLLEFHFGSSFTCLKDKFRTNPYVFSDSALIISKTEAEKMLQAVDYVLSEKYSKDTEDILNNEYVERFGSGLSSFDDRFMKHRDRVYIDKEGHGWTLSFGDPQFDAEIAECDADARFNLKRMHSCLRAFVDAESNEYSGNELVLEYSVY